MRESGVYVVVYVGCIECGVPTEVVGVYLSSDEAADAVAGTNAGGDSWARHGGDGFVEAWGPLEIGATYDPGTDPHRDA